MKIHKDIVICLISSKYNRNIESNLSKKHNAIAYHLCWEAVAAGTIIVAKEDSEQMSKERREDLMFKFMY